MLPAIIILGVVLRLYRLGGQSLWFDEMYAIWANRLPVGGLIREHLASGHPPLYYLVMRVWFALGTNEYWIRLFSVLAGAATIWLVYLAGKELYSRKAGLWGAAFTSLSPLLVWYSRAATFYSFMIALATLSFYMLVRCSRHGGWLNWAGYTIATVAVFSTYFFAGVLLVAGTAVFLLLRSRDNGRLVPWLVCTSLLCAAAIASFFASRQAISESTSRLHFPGMDELLRLIYGIALAPFVLSAGPLDEAMNYKGTEGAPKSHLLALLLVIVVTVVIMGVSPRVRRWFTMKETRAVCLYAAILVAGPLALQIANQGLLSGRFYVWAAPVLMLLAGAAVAAIPGKKQVVAGVAILVGLIFLSGWTLSGGHIARDADWQGMLGIVADQKQDQDRMLCFPLHNCVMAAGYYLPGEMSIVGGMPSMTDNRVYFMPRGAEWTGYRSGYWAGTGASPPLGDGDLGARVSEDLAGAGRVWLVAEPQMLQKYPEVGEALGENWTNVGEWDYGYFKLGLYERHN
jgi:4-amino-4-deoxy-L-arabinose transferase-like glycosyltransferase